MSWVFVIYILLLHWVFDIYFQSHEMATNKSESLKWLSIHSFIYSLLGIIICLHFYLPIITCLYFMLFLFATHMAIDGLTSKINSVLWKRNRMHDLFVVIGLDQILHYACIFWFLEVALRVTK
jgi:energy-coupling factor transporter transmembrane protein EcfT